MPKNEIGRGVGFDRIRRITGYLVGTTAHGDSLKSEKNNEADTPPTNGDRIRTMDNKKLSEWLCSIMVSECCDRTCPGREFCEFGHKGLLDWLQAIYKEEN